MPILPFQVTNLQIYFCNKCPTEDLSCIYQFLLSFKLLSGQSTDKFMKGPSDNFQISKPGVKIQCQKLRGNPKIFEIFPQQKFLLRNMDDYTTTRLLEEHRDYLRLLEEHRDYLRLLEEHRDCSSNKVFVEEHRDCSSNKVFVEEHRYCSSNKFCTVCTVPQTKFVLFVLFLKQNFC